MGNINSYDILQQNKDPKLCYILMFQQEFNVRIIFQWNVRNAHNFLSLQDSSLHPPTTIDYPIVGAGDKDKKKVLVKRSP